MYYVIAIVLPCVILGILAFRGILNDQALEERETRKNLLDLSQRISENTLLEIDLIKKNILPMLEVELPASTSLFRDNELAKFISRQPVISQAFM